MNNLNNTNPSALTQLKTNSSWFLLFGIGLIIFGCLAISFSLVSTLVSIMYLGVFLAIAGIFEGAKAFKMSQWGSFFLHVALCVLYLASGLYMIFNPAVNAVTLTLLLAIFFVVTGIMRMAFALTKQVPHPGWMLFNGTITLILGLLIWQQWPASGLWVIGTFIGIEMILTGWTWIMVSIMAKKLLK